MKKLVVVLLSSVVATCSFALTETVDGITWTYTASNGRVTIGGTSSSTAAIPTSIAGSVTVPSSISNMPVVAIGKYAFYNCKNLTSVGLPDTIEEIGERAFYYCSGLKSIKLPDGLKYIGKYAFYDCGELRAITIPYGVESIGEYAFYYCESLSEIEIPDSVTTVGANAFYYCKNVLSVKLSESMMEIPAYAFEYCSKLQSIEIPPSVKSIGAYAFENCDALVSLCIPDTVVAIGNYTFYDCDNLVSVKLPCALTTIPDHAFYGCEKLQTIEIPSSVKSIGAYAFENCDALVSLYIPDTVVAIGNYTFYDCDNLVLVKLPNTLTAIPDYAFYGCEKLQTVEIPSSVSGIGAYAFSGCKSLYGLKIPDGVTSIGNYAFQSCAGLDEVIVPDNVVQFGNGVFSGCSLLTSVALPAKIKAIPQYTFQNCALLTEFNFPAGIVSVDSYAFSGCSYLQTVRFNSELRTISNDVFENCGLLREVVFQEGLVSIGNYAFESCSALAEAAIPESVTSIGNYCFKNCSALREVKLPTTIAKLGDYMFSGCTSLGDFALPEGLTKISDGLFYGCIGLSEIAIGANVTAIGKSSFEGCVGLSRMVIPSSVTSIGDNAFAGCTGLRTVSVGDGLASIGENAFKGCVGLSDFDISSSNNVYASYDGAVYTKDLKRLICCLASSGTISIPSQVEVVEDFAFSVAAQITSVRVPSAVREISENAFSGCDTMIAIEVDPSNPFYASVDGVLYDKTISTLIRCPSAKTSITWPTTVSAIAPYAFQGSSIQSMTLPSTINAVGDYAFYGSGMRSIVLHDNVEEIGDYSFSACKNLTSIDIPVSVESIGKYAFSNCTAMRKLVIPETVLFVGDAVLSGCANLRSITIPSSVRAFWSLFGEDSYYPTVNANVDEIFFTEGWGMIDLVSFFYGRNAYHRSSTVTVHVPKSVTDILCDRYGSSYYDTYLYDSRVVFVFEGDAPTFYDDYWFEYFGRQYGCAIKVKRGTIGWDDYISRYQGYGYVTFVWYGGDATIRYNANGGTGTMDDTAAVCGLESQLSPNVFQKAFSRFKGWATKEGGTEVVYRDQSRITLNSPVTLDLYAVWETIGAPTIVGCDKDVFSGESCVLSIVCDEPGAVIYYSTNGATPRLTENNLYKGPFLIYGSVTIIAVGVVNGVYKSAYTTKTIKQVSQMSFEESINAPDRSFVFGGDVAWSATPMLGASDDWCVQSGSIGAGGTSEFSLLVEGPGTICFALKMSCEHDDNDACTWDRFVMYVDGDAVFKDDGEHNWSDVSYEVRGEGTHLVTFAYEKDDYDDDPYLWDDCAWMDNLEWIPSAQTSVSIVEVVTNGESVVTNKIAIPMDWMARNGDIISERAGVSSWTDLSASDLASVLKMSGNNGVPFYASYVAGLDPAKENDKFMAFITIEEGAVKIAYSPELNAEEKALRKYTTWGKKSLLDANWTEVPEGHEAEYNFFKVSVGMR